MIGVDTSANGFACAAGAQDFTASEYRDDRRKKRWVTVKGTCSCQTPGYTLTFGTHEPTRSPRTNCTWT